MDNLTVRFLRSAENVLKKSKSSEKIDSVINQLRLKSLDFSPCMPNEINSSEICMKCGNVWRKGLFSLHVKCHENNKIKKLIRKIDRINVLSPCRKDYLSYYKSQKDNTLVKKCLVCKSIMKYYMNKPFTKVKKETFSLHCVKNQNSSMNGKRKRKSGKKQSFAGLSPAAVLQARLSSTKIDKPNLQAIDVSENFEPIDIKTLSEFVENNPLLPYKTENPDKMIASTSIPQTVPKSESSLGILEDRLKKQKLKNDATTVRKKKSKRRKKKSSLFELESLL